MQVKVPVAVTAAPVTTAWPLKLQNTPSTALTPNVIAPVELTVPIPLPGLVTVTTPSSTVDVIEPDSVFPVSVVPLKVPV